jgi:cobalamin-dependent methionine synthase I
VRQEWEENIRPKAALGLSSRRHGVQENFHAHIMMGVSNVSFFFRGND